MKNTICRILFLCFALILILALSGCETDLPLGGYPTSFIKNVLIEEVTGSWCGFCPRGAGIIHELEEANPGRIIAAAFHTSDAMAISEITDVANWLGGYSGVPCGSVSRLDTYGDILGYTNTWSSLTTDSLEAAATCAVKVSSSISGSSLSIETVSGFKQVPDVPVKLTVYIVEDGVTGYPQSNYYNDDPDSEFYQLGQPIEDYVHDHVVRAVLTNPEGDAVTQGTVSTSTPYTNNYTYSVAAGQITANLSVIAFIHGSGTASNEKYVLNAAIAASGLSSE